MDVININLNGDGILMGGIAGYVNNSFIENIYVSGYVNASSLKDSQVGLGFGYISNVTMQNITSFGMSQGSGTGNFVNIGGIAGLSYQSYVYNTHSNVDVYATGLDDVGGMTTYMSVFSGLLKRYDLQNLKYWLPSRFWNWYIYMQVE